MQRICVCSSWLNRPQAATLYAVPVVSIQQRMAEQKALLRRWHGCCWRCQRPRRGSLAACHGSWGWFGAVKRVQAYDIVTKERLPEPVQEISELLAAAAYITVPVRDRGATIGRLYLTAAHRYHFAPSDVDFLLQVNRERAARYGVLPGDVNGTVQAAIGGQVATQVLDGDRRFDVVVRFLPQYRASVEAIANIPVSTPDGSTVPLTAVADIRKQTGASFIYREDNARYIPIKFSVRGRDLQSTLTEAASKIRSQVTLPQGYTYTRAGEFEELQAAVRRLQVIVPVSVLGIFCLLYGTFR